MPASRRSSQLTEAYRQRKLAIASRVQRAARDAWPQIAELDTTRWSETMAAQLTRAQIEGVRLASGYLTAFIASETGRRGRTTSIPTQPYVGVSRDGRPLTEALKSPIIGVLGALKGGRSPDEALRLGLVKAERMVGFEAMQTPRAALLDAIDADPRIEGFQRSVAGTCAACEALSGTGGPRFEVHPGCECEPQPVIKGVRDAFPIPTGIELFRQKSPAEQDASFGPEAAQLIRDGADLKDFVSHSRTDSDQPNWMTQRPSEQVAT